MKNVIRKSESIYEVYERKPGSDKVTTHYCPGCGHGVMHKLIAEALDDLGLQDRAVFVSPVGCSVFAYYYMDVGNFQSAHGRAPAVATGVKRSRPDSILISYQGDGDLAAIGTNNMIQAANRGELISIFFINNAIYGMTGGQMAPTTLEGQVTTTTPRGRAPDNDGFPFRVCEVLSALSAPVYLERVALTDTKNTNKARRAVRKALKAQADGLGFTLVEALSPCPTGWKVDPLDSKKWIHEKMEPVFPLGVFRDETDTRKPKISPVTDFDPGRVRSVLDLPEEGDGAGREDGGIEERYRNPEIKTAGFGGQGVLMLGVVLGEIGLELGHNVSWLPSYGPEMRGGTAHCHVIINEEEVGTPLSAHPTVLFAFNRPSLDRFEPEVREGGLIVYDDSLIDRTLERTDVEAVPVPATKVADDLGSTRAANMVALGAYLGYTGYTGLETVKRVLPRAIKHKKLIPLNEKAISEGMKLGLAAKGGQ